MKRKLLLFICSCLVGISMAQLAPLEHYKFDNGSVKSENGLGANSTQTSIHNVNLEINKAISVDGSASISLGKPAFNTANGFSISFWVKPSANLSGSYVIFGQRSVCNWTNMFSVNLNTTTSRISLELRSANSSYGASSCYVEYTPGEWQKVTFVMDRTTSEIYGYTNNVLENTTTLNVNTLATTFTSTNVLISGSPCLSASLKRYVGRLDELKFYNGVVSSQQVSNDYIDETTTSLTDEEIKEQFLQVHYKFDSSSVNEVFFRNDHNDQPKEAFYFNSAKSLDLGSDNFVTSNGFSVSMWLKPDEGLTGSHVILSKRSVCNWTNAFQVTLNGTNKTVALSLLKSSQVSTGINATYTEGEWHKYTFTFDAVAGKLNSYVDGALSNTSAITAANIPATFTAASLLLATGPCVGVDGSLRYKGAIEDVYIYESTLSDANVSTAYSTDDDDQFSPSFVETCSKTSPYFYAEMELIDRDDASTTDIDNALYLDGSTSYTLRDGSIQSELGYTFSFWVKPSSDISNTSVIFGQRSVCNNANIFLFKADGATNEILAEFRTSAGNAKGLRVAYTPDEWQQITYTVDLENKLLKGYVDGQLVGSTSINGNEFVTSYSSSFYVSYSPCLGNGVVRYEGGLDEIKIFGLPLTADQIEDEYNLQVITSIDGPESVESLNIYPNPATSIINTEEGQLDIYDALSNHVLSTESTGKVDVSGLESGIYIVSQNGKRTKLIIE